MMESFDLLKTDCCNAANERRSATAKVTACFVLSLAAVWSLPRQGVFFESKVECGVAVRSVVRSTCIVNKVNNAHTLLSQLGRCALRVSLCLWRAREEKRRRHRRSHRAREPTPAKNEGRLARKDQESRTRRSGLHLENDLLQFFGSLH
jgi:hypothetical protein